MIKPLGKFLLVKVCEDVKREEVTASGIVVTRPKDDRIDLVVSKARVIEISDQVEGFKKDDIVYFNYFAGNVVVEKGKDPMGKDDKEMILVHTEDVLAIEK